MLAKKQSVAFALGQKLCNHKNCGEGGPPSSSQSFICTIVIANDSGPHHTAGKLNLVMQLARTQAHTAPNGHKPALPASLGGSPAADRSGGNKIEASKRGRGG